MTPSILEKVFFGMGEKVVFYYLCFWKAVFAENTMFSSAFNKTQQLQQKLYVEKNSNLWKVVAGFWAWQKSVFV